MSWLKLVPMAPPTLHSCASEKLVSQQLANQIALHNSSAAKLFWAAAEGYTTEIYSLALTANAYDQGNGALAGRGAQVGHFSHGLRVGASARKSPGL